MKNILPILCLLFIATSATLAVASPPGEAESEPKEEKKHFIGTSAFVLFNLIPFEDEPSFAQLNYGYRLTPKDTISVEAITWKYHGPLGVPEWEGGAPNSKFPGYVRDFGVGLAYQRYLWKGLYGAVHAMPFIQQYYGNDDELIQTGFQLFVAMRLGYHVRFWDDMFFIEPSVAATAWPINTNLPDDFAVLEDKWPLYAFEPGFHVGANF